MKQWLCRALILGVVLVGGVISLQYTTRHFKADRQIILLNTTRPDFQKFLAIEKQNTAIVSSAELKEYFDYFKLVTDAMPNNADGALMLGFLYKISGNKDQAVIFLNKAKRLDPAFFYTLYNLAMMSFERGDYDQSIALLQQALAIPPGSTIKRMMDSIIYRQFLASMKDRGDFLAGLQGSYHDAYVLLLESVNKQKGNQSVNADAPTIHARVM